MTLELTPPHGGLVYYLQVVLVDLVGLDAAPVGVLRVDQVGQHLQGALYALIPFFGHFSGFFLYLSSPHEMWTKC